MAAKETFELDLDAQAFNSAIGQAIKGLENLQKSMNKTEEETKKVEKAAKDTGKGFSGLADAAAGAPGPLGAVASQMKSLTAVMVANPIVAVGAAVVGLTVGLGKLAHGTAEANDQIIDLADATGMAATELSRYQVLAEKVLPSENIEKLAEGFSKLSVQQRAAFDGNEDLQTAFEYFGVTSSNSAEMLNQLADGFNRTAGDVDRTAFLVKIFGDGLAKELAPALALGSEGIRELTQLNDEYGRTLDEDAIRATSEYQENIKELSLRFDGLAATIGNSVIPMVNGLFDALTLKSESAGLGEKLAEDNTVVEELGNLFGEGTEAAVDFSAALAGLAGPVTETTNRIEKKTKITKEANTAEDEYLKLLWAQLYAMIAADKEWERLGEIISKNIGMTDEQWAANSRLSDGLEQDLIPPLKITKEDMKGVGEATEDTGKKITWFSLTIGNIKWNKVSEALVEGAEKAKFYADQLSILSEAIGSNAEYKIEKAVETQQAIEDAALAELRAKEGVTADEISLAEKASAAKMKALEEGLKEGSKAMKVAFLLQQGAALASIGISTAEAIVKGIAIFGPPPSPAGIAAIATASLVGGVAAASVLSQTIGEFKGTSISFGGIGGNGPTQGATQPGSNGSNPGPGASVGTGKPSADDTFTDTPGPIMARAGYNTFRFSPGDMVMASKSPAGLGNQLGGIETLKEARNHTALLEEIRDLLSMNQTTSRHSFIGYRP